MNSTVHRHQDRHQRSRQHGHQDRHQQGGERRGRQGNEHLDEPLGRHVVERRHEPAGHAGRLTLVPTPTAADLERMIEAGNPSGVALRRPAAMRPPVRLTRRGRLVVVGLFLLALFGGGVLFGTGSKAGATDAAGPSRTYDYVVVQPGQTLWTIAKQIAPHDDPRATIEAIRRLNALSDTGIQAGQRIALP